MFETVFSIASCRKLVTIYNKNAVSKTCDSHLSFVLAFSILPPILYGKSYLMGGLGAAGMGSGTEPLIRNWFWALWCGDGHVYMLL